MKRVLRGVLFLGCVLGIIMPGCNSVPSPSGSGGTGGGFATIAPTDRPLGSVDLLAGVEQQTLDNGMKVFLKEDRQLPVVTVVVAYRVGSVHEPEGTSGLAHFLEHMLFKGTDRYAKGEIDKITVQAGGSNNAFTDTDFTLYWFSVSAEALDDVLQIEASLMRNSALDMKEFDEERKIVTEELYRLLDSPDGQLQYEIDQAVFKTHSYRRPGWGFEADLKSVKHDVMKSFYTRHYGPNNAALVVVGDFDKGRVATRVRELFGRFSRVDEAVPPTPPEPAQVEERRLELATDKAVDRVGLAWRTSSVGSDDDIVLDVIQNLLSTGKDSRLYRRLVIKDRAASSVEALNNTRRYDGVFYIFAEASGQKSAKDVEASIFDTLEELKTVPVKGRELKKAKNLITAQYVFAHETGKALAEAIGRYEGLGVPDYGRTYLSRIEAVTADQIQGVAKRVFRAENRTVAVARAKHERRAECVPFLQSAPIEFGEVYEVRLPNGLTVLVKPRRGLPVMSVKAYVDAGPMTESAEKAGVATLTGALLDQGYAAPDGRSKTAEELAESIEFAGVQLETSAEGISFTCLTRDASMMLDVLRDMLLYPAFPKEKVELVRGQQLDDINSAGDDPGDFARQIWYREVFAGHPWERPSNGTAATVEKLTLADVEAHHRAYYRPENTILAIAGDVDPESLLREVRRRFIEWPVLSSDGVIAPRVADVTRPESGKKIVEFRKSKQIQLCFGHVSLPYTHPDFFALRVFEQIFCNSPAFTDRLSRIVREDMHLAYEAWGRVTMLERCQAPFMVNIGTGSQHGLTAHQVTLKILEELAKDGPTEEEFTIAKSYLMRSIPFRWESTADLVDTMVTLRRLRLGMDWPYRYRAGLAAVTREDVVRVARTHIVPAAFTTVIVGPVDKDGKVIEDEK